MKANQLTRKANILALLFWVLLSAQAHAVRSISWDRTAIPIHLVVGVEQMLHFPQDGDVGLPPTLANTDVFRTLFTGKTGYWTALQVFERERIKVRLSTGDFILFDVSATVAKQPPKKMEALNIVMDDSPNLLNPLSDKVPGNVLGNDAVADNGITVFGLLRYAAQVTYAPARLVDALPGIRQAPTGMDGALNTLYNQGNHSGLIFLPQDSWAAQGFWVTSIRVLNQHSHPIALDNRLVQHTPTSHINGVGRHFIASMFYQRHLEPGEKTTLFVVTDQPFQSVIRF
jgi:integrating conjugative element protein (TIGR03749 family)